MAGVAANTFTIMARRREARPTKGAWNMTNDDSRRVRGSGLLPGAILLLAMAGPADADEAYARQKIQEMSDFMAGAQAISLDFDAGLDAVTENGEKLTLASSATSSSIARTSC